MDRGGGGRRRVLWVSGLFKREDTRRGEEGSRALGVKGQRGQASYWREEEEKKDAWKQNARRSAG